MIKVVYACNDAMFDGLYLSILSIVRRCDNPVSFYLLTDDFLELDASYKRVSDKHIQQIEMLVKSYNPENSFNVIRCANEHKKYLTGNINRSRCTVYADLRLLMDVFPSLNGKVIYLDTDTMACGNIKQLFDVDLGNDNEFAVAHNPPFTHWYQRKNYFNSGVILFNMDLVRKNKLLEKTRNLLTKKKFYSPDQTALYFSATKYCFFPDDEYRFNRQTNKIKKDDVIKHFIFQFWRLPGINGIKQWEIDRVHKYLKIHTFDEDFAIYLKMKESEK